MLFEGDPEPYAPEGLVTVGRFESPIEAQIARGLLESSGIECFMVGENANQLLASAFRVRLQVRIEEEDEALDLLSGDRGRSPDKASQS